VSKLDKAFNEKLYHRQESVPEGIWDKIASDLDAIPKDHNSKYLFYWISTAVIVVSMVAVGLYKYYDNSPIPSSDSDRVSYSNNLENEKRNIASIKKGAIITNRETFTGSALSSTLENTLTDNTETTDIQLNTVQNIVSNNKNNLSLTKQNGYQSPIVKNDFFSVRTEQALEDPTHSYLLPTNTINEQRGSINLGTTKKATDQKDIYKLDESSKLSNYSSRLITDAPSLLPRDIVKIENEIRDYDANRLLTDCPSFIETRPGFHLELYVSPDYAVRSFSSADRGLENYIDQRIVTEEPFFSYSAGFRISYTMKTGMAFKTGLNYSQINERFDYINPDSIQILTLEDGEGNIIEQTTLYGRGEIRTHNAYKSLDIPLLVALEMPFNDKFSVGLNTGVFVNMLFSQKGTFLDEELKPVSISGSNYKSSLGLSFTGSIAMHYYLSPRLDFMIEPNLRYYSQSFTSDSYPVTQEYLKLGLLTGIRYNF